MAAACTFQPERGGCIYCLGAKPARHKGCNCDLVGVRRGGSTGVRRGGSRKDHSPNKLHQIPLPRSLVKLRFPQSFFSAFFLFSNKFW